MLWWTRSRLNDRDLRRSISIFEIWAMTSSLVGSGGGGVGFSASVMSGSHLIQGDDVHAGRRREPEKIVGNVRIQFKIGKERDHAGRTRGENGLLQEPGLGRKHQVQFVAQVVLRD